MYIYIYRSMHTCIAHDNDTPRPALLLSLGVSAGIVDNTLQTLDGSIRVNVTERTRSPANRASKLLYNRGSDCCLCPPVPMGDLPWRYTVFAVHQKCCEANLLWRQRRPGMMQAQVQCNATKIEQNLWCVARV